MITGSLPTREQSKLFINLKTSTMIENIKARLFGKPFCVWTEKVVKKGNDNYYLYNGTIYYGNRLFVFFKSSANFWYNDQTSRL